jgi:hypothetical protein
MPKRDIYHETVKQSLIKDGWTITHDQFNLKIGKKTLYADLGAERLISAEKGIQKIIVEIKSFVGHSEIYDLQQALGQYIMYEEILQEQHSERLLYMAVNEITYQGIFSTEIGQLLLARQPLRLIIFDEYDEAITQWIN